MWKVAKLISQTNLKKMTWNLCFLRRFSLEQAILERDGDIDKMQQKINGLQAQIRLVTMQNKDLSQQVCALQQQQQQQQNSCSNYQQNNNYLGIFEILNYN